jgi:hypothetical protein
MVDAQQLVKNGVPVRHWLSLDPLSMNLDRVVAIKNGPAGGDWALTYINRLLDPKQFGDYAGLVGSFAPSTKAVQPTLASLPPIAVDDIIKMAGRSITTSCIDKFADWLVALQQRDRPPLRQVTHVYGRPGRDPRGLRGLNPILAVPSRIPASRLGNDIAFVRPNSAGEPPRTFATGGPRGPRCSAHFDSRNSSPEGDPQSDPLSRVRAVVRADAPGTCSHFSVCLRAILGHSTSFQRLRDPHPRSKTQCLFLRSMNYVPQIRRTSYYLGPLDQHRDPIGQLATFIAGW